MHFAEEIPFGFALFLEGLLGYLLESGEVFLVGEILLSRVQRLA